MKNLKTLLRDADPPGDLPEREAQAIRRAVVAAVKERPAPAVIWSHALALAAMLLLMLGTGATIGRRIEPPARTAATAPPALSEGGGERRQLQFATPGGTRIIWVFNPRFDSREVMP